MDDKVVTAIGTPNKALVMYWGKRNNRLNLPMNSSLSITLDESLNTRTSIVFSKKIKRDAIYVNGEKHDLEARAQNEKMMLSKRVIDRMRSLSGTKAKALIVSRNSFPTSTGLASSSSGAATLVFAASQALGLKASARELSILARQISGSGSRSLMGGFVKWTKGSKPDGSDSYAEQVASEKYWPEVMDIIAVFTASKKKVSSSEGHDLTLKQSKLYFLRPEYAEDRLEAMSDAIRARDFEPLAEMIMRDSNNMHATMLDTYPPIMYLDDRSREAIYAIHELNQSEGKNIAAYTFDAGPNAHVITLRKYKSKVMGMLGELIGDGKILAAGQGSGPRLLGESESLIDYRSLKPTE
ncbi:MAG: diphosphomevalonate decarboxylase [Candidatus Micrarchaeota archaeon]|nr:diphosphomevalonate decarboxylase [Candidatus Micrarchaeota archaeon]MDE1847395.1 diphosphomevalonate decarboxylase [Candidatus Micrarchaeota archaeon]MDE1864010.1 diphosphomevalonate decarboxylase [Candidatus Micrarchaeota archaeon]